MTYPPSALFLRLGGYRFVPLVTKHLSLEASVHIDFFRSGVPGDLLDGGDIDNRVKVLLDALRLPHNEAELAGDRSPTHGSAVSRPDPADPPRFINPGQPQDAGTPIWSTKPIHVEAPTDPDEVFFTLLEDDSLVAGFSVETSQLLAPIDPAARIADVWLKMEVTVSATSNNLLNFGIA